jgi:hypothetical protein
MPSTSLLLLWLSWFSFCMFTFTYNAFYFLWMDFHPCLHIYIQGCLLLFRERKKDYVWKIFEEKRNSLKKEKFCWDRKRDHFYERKRMFLRERASGWANTAFAWERELWASEVESQVGQERNYESGPNEIEFNQAWV